MHQNLTVMTKKEKMVVIFFYRGKIIFLEMEKFQWWIAKRDMEWV
jgi:hypothetical protein